MSSLLIPDDPNFFNLTGPLAGELSLNDIQDTTPGSITLSSTGESAINADTSGFRRFQLAADSTFNIGFAPLDPTEATNRQDLNVVPEGVFQNAEEFTIGQLDEDGNVEREFKFSLLPAIESTVGGKQVPEVKPGILKRVSQNIKTFNLPGAIPAFQVLGVKPTMLQLVGLLIGSETVTDSEVSPPNAGLQGPGLLYRPDLVGSALWYAEYFEKFLTQRGRPVQIDISDSQMVLQYKALIQNHRHFITRNDRVYYSLEVLILDYPTYRVSRFDTITSQPTAVPVTNQPRTLAELEALQGDTRSIDSNFIGPISNTIDASPSQSPTFVLGSTNTPVYNVNDNNVENYGPFFFPETGQGIQRGQGVVRPF